MTKVEGYPTDRGFEMSHILTLDVPSEVYDSLLQIAKRAGQSPEVVAVNCLAAATHQHIDDPMEKFIGAWHSNEPSWADQHDAYLGQAIVRHSANTGNGEYDD